MSGARLHSECLSDAAISSSLDPGAAYPPHLDGCAACRERRAGLAEAIELARRLPTIAPSGAELDQSRAELLTRVADLEERGGRGVWALFRREDPPFGRGRVWPWALGAAAAALLIGLATVALRELDPPEMQGRGSVVEIEPARFEHELTRSVQGSLQDEAVRLHQGRLEIRVAKLGANQRFRVLCEDGEVEVRGTVFQVTVEHERLVAVSVSEGVVSVRRHGEAPVWLEAGSSWRASPSAPLETHGAVALVASEARDAGLRADSAASAAAVRVGGARRVEVPPAPDAPIEVPSSLAAPDAGAIASLLDVDDAGVVETPAIPLDAGVVAAPPPPAAPAAPIVDLAKAEVEFRQGWSELRDHRDRAAIDHFAAAERLAGKDPLAEDAGYWRAVTLAKRDPQGLRQFLQAYPRSSRWAAVALLLAEDALARHEKAEARQLLERVAAGSDLVRAAEARKLLLSL